VAKHSPADPDPRHPRVADAIARVTTGESTKGLVTPKWSGALRGTSVELATFVFGSVQPQQFVINGHEAAVLNVV
jgi:hypothetical protein